MDVSSRNERQDSNDANITKETLIKEFSIKAGEDMLQVDVHLQKVEILRIKLAGSRDSAFYNVTLAGL
jgi:hypothetical protein